MVRTDLLRPLPELLRAGAGRAGIAFADVRREVTHAELAARTERLAGHLADLGVRPGDRVVVLLDGVAGVESVLAAVRAGAVAVPIDSTVDSVELARLLTDAGAATVITNAAGAARVSPRVLIVDGPYDGPALDYEMLATTDSVSAARDGGDLDGLAFRRYTAGVTGPRRGVTLRQRAVLWAALGSYADVLSHRDRLMWTLPLHCEVAHVYAAVVTGASVWLAAGLNSTEVRHALAEQQSTVVAANAAMLGELRRVTPSVRFGLLVGVGTADSQFPLLNVYTVTETGGPVAMSRPGDDRLVPLPGVTVLVIDEEILVGGPTVDGWYHTGDLGSLDEFERLTITGRAADLVRVGDEVVRLAQVDAALRSVPGVRDAAIANGPVAYVVAAGVAAADLFTACRAALTAAAVPAELYAVREIPRTATGSPLRHRLPGLPARLLGVAAGTHETLFAQHWEPLPEPADEPGEWAVAGPAELTAGLDVPGFVIDGHTDLDTLSELVTSWLDEHNGIRLVLLTHGAVHAGGYAPDPTRAAAWGLARAQQLRHPGRLVLVDATAVTEEALAAAVASGEDELAVRSGELLRPSYTSVPSASAGPPLSGTVVLVSEVYEADLARHLAAAHDVRELVLACPAGAPPAAVAELVSHGADVAIHGEIATALEERFVDAVVGVDLTSAEALTLHEVTLANHLSAFVLVSTGADAAATAVAEALVRHRRTLELPAVSVAWTRPGFTELPTSWRTAMIDAALAVTEPCVVAGLRGDQQADAVRAALRERVMAAADREQVLLDVVHTEIAVVLGGTHAPASFHELGMDWQTTVRLRTRLCVATGLDLPSTVTTDHPTPAALVAHLLALLDVPAPTEEPVAWQEKPVAVIAMGRVDLASLRGRDTVVFPSGSTAALRLAIHAVSTGECLTAVAGDKNGMLAVTQEDHPALAVLRMTERSTVDVPAVIAAVTALRMGSPLQLPGVTIEIPAPTTPMVVPWLLSAPTEQALRDEAAWLASTVGELNMASVGRSLLTRPTFPHRAAITGATRADLLAGLTALATGTPLSTVVTGKARRGRLAFLFTGQGAQRLGMGAELAATFPVFAHAFTAACEALDQHLPRPLNEVLNTEALHDTEFAQPALFALEVALFRLLESWGVRPDYVAGHSIGEFAAAHVAGVWSLADAAHLVAARARLMQALPSGGAMVAVEATETEVATLLSPTMAIAAINGPTSLVLSGESAATLAAAEELADIGRKTSQLAVSHAFHSPLMAPMLPRFEAIAETIPHHAPKIPLVSTLTGEILVPTPRYWAEQARSPVRFADAVTTLTARGVRTFVELGPDTTLTTMTRECVPDELAVIPTLTAKHPETRTIAAAFGHLFTAGSTVDGTAFFPQAATVELPLRPPEHRSA